MLLMMTWEAETKTWEVETTIWEVETTIWETMRTWIRFKFSSKGV